MCNIIIKLPKTVEEILDRLESAGFAAYAVGGAVRDLIRGIEPHDFDLTTAAKPEQVMEVFKGETIIPTGLQHGTVTLVIDHVPYEITTFRGEGEYTDHRRPDQVEFIDSIEADLARRDFTAGAIAYSPKRGLCDPFGGVGDVYRGILRAVGDPMTRFREDGLRILRALRFASACGFTIEEETAAALHEGKHLVRPIAAERKYTELTKTLCGANARQILGEFGDVLAEVIPELEPTFGCPQHTSYHDRDVWIHTLDALQAIPNEPVLRWTMLLHDIAKPQCRRTDVSGVDHFKTHPEKGAPIAGGVLARLKAERVTREEVTALIELHDIDLPDDRGGVHRLLIRHGKERILRLLAVKEADLAAKSPYGQTHGRDVILPWVKQTVRSLIDEGAPLSVRDLDLRGSDLAPLGYRGRAVGEALASLLDAVTRGVPNEKEALLMYLNRQSK